MSIPRTIHQIWLGNKPLPAAHEAFRESIIRMHPGWDVKLWTNEDYRDSVDFAEWSARATSLASVSNWMRLDIIFKHGGIYLDTDVEVLRPLDDFLKYRGFCAFQGVDDGHICNAIFGAERKNPWVGWQLENAWMFQTYDAACGPKLMTLSPQYRDKWKQVEYISTPLLYPFNWDEEPDMSRVTKETYAIHHWDNSWNK